MGKNGKRRDRSPWMKPINVTSIVVAAILGYGPSVGATATQDVLHGGDSNIICEQVLDKAIKEQKADPLVHLRYSGPAEEKCGINRVIDEWP